MEGEKNIFDDNNLASDSDDVKEENGTMNNKSETPVVARPTTKPTDRTKKTESSYTFWKETDQAKLETFPQFKDDNYIKP